jgi:anti-sigma regulatory factor (Ser/Thr protein kinase)
MAGEHSSSQVSSRGGWNTESGNGDDVSAAFSCRQTDTPVIALESDIRLTLPARAENVWVVRHVVGAFAEAVGMPRSVSEDIRLAVTEACTNVVRHAYGDDDGRIDIVVRPTGEALEVIVSDTGRGIGPSPDTEGPGLGLPLIAAVTDRLEIQRTSSAGSRIVMSFVRAPAAREMRIA